MRPLIQPNRVRVPCALTIAGSDSGGGAGVQADLKMFAALGVHGTSVVTCVTAQNPKRVCHVTPISPLSVRAQIEAVFEELPPAAIKTGMLFSKAIICEVVSVLKLHKTVPVVVDPVMVSTSGSRLLKPDAFKVLCEQLLPLADLITPNLHEAAWLLGRSLDSVDDLQVAARALHGRFGCAVLLKGGHLPQVSCARGPRYVVDVFHDGKDTQLLKSTFVENISTHGTGCTMSAAIASHLALGRSLKLSVGKSKRNIANAIKRSVRCHAHDVLWPF